MDYGDDDVPTRLPGANEVALYEVERTRGGAVFHQLAD